MSEGRQRVCVCENALMNRVPYQPGKESELLIRSFFFFSPCFFSSRLEFFFFFFSLTIEKEKEMDLPLHPPPSWIQTTTHAHSLPFQCVFLSNVPFPFSTILTIDPHGNAGMGGRTTRTDCDPFFLVSCSHSLPLTLTYLQRPLDKLTNPTTCPYT